MMLNLVNFFRVQSKPVTNQRNLQPSRVAQLAGNKPVLISLDIDGTLIPWRQSNVLYDQTAFLRYQHALQSPELKKDSFIVLNTGRGLKATQKLAPLLAKIPFNALSLNDGQQLFIRPTPNPQLHPNVASQQWIEKLTLKQLDKPWKRELNGWSTIKVLKDVQELMCELEFQLDSVPNQASRYVEGNQSYVFTKPASIWDQTNKQNVWVVRLDPDQAYLEISRFGKKAAPEELAHYAEVLGRLLKYHLKEDWPNFSSQINTLPDRCFLHIGPKNHSKASLVNYLANQRLVNKPKAIISAGDNNNDLPLLSANQLGDVPNYPILVGDNANVKKVLAKKEPSFLEYVGWNQLHEGIEKQFLKIKPLIQSKPSTSHAERASERLNQVG